MDRRPFPCHRCLYSVNPSLGSVLNIIYEGRPKNLELTSVFVIVCFFNIFHRFVQFPGYFSNHPISRKLFPPEMAFNRFLIPARAAYVFLSTDPTSILRSSMSRMVLRWYLVTRLLSGHTSTTYLRWTVARLSEVTAYP